jgi:hydroxyacylglutathione hydrolase
MKIQIFTLKFGINRCYIIKGEQAIMVDGGPPNQIDNFLKQLSVIGMKPEEIKLIVLTHGDFDHIGSAKAIKEATGAKAAIHENDRRFLEEGCFNWPPGVTPWGISARFLVKPFFKHKKILPLKPDIVLTEKDFPLDDYGINGKIIYTPGHTSGSVSVLLESGEAFVGCMAHNGFPFRTSPGLPIFAEDIEKIKENWKLLSERGARIIYPGHGNAFAIDKIFQKKCTW